MIAFMKTEGRERVERRLAAILAADVAGYSRLMGADEEGMLAALKAIRRESSAPKIAGRRFGTNWAGRRGAARHGRCA